MRTTAEEEKPHVWFLDDDPVFLEGLRRSLRHELPRWQSQFLTAPEAVLERMESERNVVLVSDWMMPGMTGLELCVRIRELHAEDDSVRPYVILLTGRSEPASSAEALERGADDHVAKPVARRELIARVEVGIRMVSLQRNLQAANARLRVQATTDPLTGLANRRWGEDVLQTELDRVGRGSPVLSLLMIDLDRFKQINDSHGHPAGDEVLRESARRLQRSCRRYDTLIRWGGEEFLLICPGLETSHLESAYARFRGQLSTEPIAIADQVDIHITASFGACTADVHSPMDIKGLVAHADRALYEAKDAGRDCLRSAGLYRGSAGTIRLVDPLMLRRHQP